METAETFFPQPAVDAALVRLKPRKTIAFAMFILYEMVNIFNCRSERHSLLKVGIFSNKWLILGVLGSLLLMVLAIQIPFTGALLSYNVINHSRLECCSCYEYHYLRCGGDLEGFEPMERKKKKRYFTACT